MRDILDEALLLQQGRSQQFCAPGIILLICIPAQKGSRKANFNSAFSIPFFFPQQFNLNGIGLKSQYLFPPKYTQYNVLKLYDRNVLFDIFLQHFHALQSHQCVSVVGHTDREMCKCRRIQKDEVQLHHYAHIKNINLASAQATVKYLYILTTEAEDLMFQTVCKNRTTDSSGTLHGNKNIFTQHCNIPCRCIQKGKFTPASSGIQLKLLSYSE